MQKIRYTNLLCLFFLFFLVWGIALSPAGTFRDDFDSPDLNTGVWEIAKAGNAKPFIKEGQLLLESPMVPDGIILYLKQELEGDAITVECEIDPSELDTGTATLGVVGFTDGIVDPEPSPDFWVHWLAHFNLSTTQASPFVDDYPGQNGFPKAGDTINFQEGSHVFRIEIRDKKVKYFVDGDNVGESDSIDTPRYFHISPDTYLSHCCGTVAVDYVEITADNVKRVSPAGRLAIAWGMVKKEMLLNHGDFSNISLEETHVDKEGPFTNARIHR